MSNLPTRNVVAAVKTLLDIQLPRHAYLATNDELVRPLVTALHTDGKFTTHGRGLQMLSTADVETSILLLQALEPDFHLALKAKAGPEFSLTFTATTPTTYDMVVAVQNFLQGELKIGSGTQDQFVARVAAYVGVSAESQSLYNQVIDSLELLKQLGERVPSYLLEENIMV